AYSIALGRLSRLRSRLFLTETLSRRLGAFGSVPIEESRRRAIVHEILKILLAKSNLLGGGQAPCLELALRGNDVLDDVVHPMPEVRRTVPVHFWLNAQCDAREP